MLPPKYMGAVMLGNGLSGIAINILRAICLAALPPLSDKPENDYYGSLIYFIMAAVILAICSVGYLIFERLEYCQYYIKKATDEKMKTHRRISGVKDLTSPQVDDQHLSLISSGNLNKTKSDT
jgi:hypothetical protein